MVARAPGGGSSAGKAVSGTHRAACPPISADTRWASLCRRTSTAPELSRPGHARIRDLIRWIDMVFKAPDELGCILDCKCRGGSSSQLKIQRKLDLASAGSGNRFLPVQTAAPHSVS